MGVAGRLSGTVSPFRAEQGTSLVQKAQGPGVCKLPKPPASRALCQAKNSNLKMLADGHNICKDAELQLIPTLNKLSGFTEGKTSKVNLGEANRKRI